MGTKTDEADVEEKGAEECLALALRHKANPLGELSRPNLANPKLKKRTVSAFIGVLTVNDGPAPMVRQATPTTKRVRTYLHKETCALLARYPHHRAPGESVSPFHPLTLLQVLGRLA